MRQLLLAGLAVTLACAPDPAAVRLAALSAAAAVDTLDDLGAVSEPEAPGVRDAFRAAAIRALEHAQAAYRTAPNHTQYAHDLSLEAAHAADQFGDAFALALEATDRLAAIEADIDDVLGRILGIRKPLTRDERLIWAKAAGPAFTNAQAAAMYRSVATAEREFAASLRRLDPEAAADVEASVQRLEAEAQGLEAEARRQAGTPTDARRLIDAAALLVETQVLQVSTTDRIETAEARRNDAISAHRRAAEAWRNLEHP